MAVPRGVMIAGVARRAVGLLAGGFVPPAMRRNRERRERWLASHDAYVGIARRGVVAAILGDSLTFGWLTIGRDVYDAQYLPRGIHAFGIGGDRTADLFYRIEHGELSGPAPRVVVILIGTNDLGYGAKDVVAGIVGCVDAARVATPASTILLLGLLPRGRGGAGSRQRLEIAAINAAVSHLDDGRRIRFLDIGGSFLRRDGSLDPDLFDRDLLHLSLEGYVVWQRAMAPALDALLAAAPGATSRI